MIRNTIAALCFLLLNASLLAQAESVQERCLTKHPADDRYASYSPDGAWIVFESNRSGHWEIYLMDTMGQQLRQLTSNDTDNRRPSWHPNGKKVLFESNRNGSPELFSINLRNGKEKQLWEKTGDGTLVFASYSPNGRNIAASLKESEDKSNIILLNKNGKQVRYLTDNERRSYYPKWAPNGDEIVFFSRKDTANEDDEIYRINIETGTDIRLTNWHKHNFCPAWSPNGQAIAYVTSMEDTRPEIYIMNTDGSQQRRITNNEDGETLPSWHPSGNKLLLTAYRNGNYEICELKL